MAAVYKNIKIKSATFKSKTIKGATQANIDSSGSEQTTRGDGAIAVQGVYVEGVLMKVVVNALEGSTTDKDLFLPGNGALVIVGFEQADGSGATGGGNKTWTFANATLTGATRGLPQDGNATVNLNFSCAAASGDPLDLYTVA